VSLAFGVNFHGRYSLMEIPVCFFLESSSREMKFSVCEFQVGKGSIIVTEKPKIIAVAAAGAQCD
jgi:hypothetical protein